MNGYKTLRHAALDNNKLTILYATQTGNAQDLAESLARHAIRRHFTTQCLSLEQYTPVCSLGVTSN